MLIGIGVLLGIVGMAMIYFNLPFSKTKKEFDRLATALIAESNSAQGVFEEDDIADLPGPVQNYFRFCGYLGTPKKAFMKATFHDVDFVLGKRRLKIDYTQYNFVNEPNRIAYIDSSRAGIPFEGLDMYTAGNGSMKGVLAKLFTLFHQTGETMDKSSLVTYLSEYLLIPSAALQHFIAWEEIDDLHTKAVITYCGDNVCGDNACGIFTFDESGALRSFTTDDRVAAAPDGTGGKVKWSAVFDEYVETNGIKRPTVLQAVWHYDNGDLVYFDSRDVVIE